MSLAQAPALKSRLAIESATAALRSGNAQDAEWTLRQRLLEQPDDVQILAHLADILADQGRDLEATLLHKRALSCEPGADNVRLALAYLLQRQGQYEAALKEVQALKPPVSSLYGARSLEAALLGLLGRHEPELMLYSELLRDFPGDETLWMSYANAQKTVGKTEESVSALRRSIKVRPTYGEAYWSLANLKTFRFGDRDIAAMRRALKNNLKFSDALHFHFALGKALEDRGDAEAAFRHYELGNQMRAAQFTPAEMVVTPRVDAAIATFGKEFLESYVGFGHEAADPIFVVGLQRSGSTLIEQILATHPMIEGTAELTAIEQIWNRLGSSGGKSGNPFLEVVKLEREEVRDLGAEYLERTRPFRRTDRPFFIDKLPANWMNIGFIKLILPNAKIIDARRHPLACGLSNFRQLYASGVTFSYSLAAIGRFYADYLRLLKHFDQTLPGAVHHVLNEDVVDDPEGEVRQLLDHVGVPFDPACLNFHLNERAVHTPSAEQVRRPINRDGVDSWRQFEPWLGPLKETLGDALDTWRQTNIPAD